MTIISLIAAIDASGGIGYQNQLLCHLPADLAYFKAKTIGKPIIMGRRTFESIGRPLPGRQNIVLSKSLSLHPGVICVDSLQSAIEKAKSAEEMMIIGGEAVFIAAMPYAHKIYLTHIAHTFTSDVFFPVLSENIWQCVHTDNRPRDLQNAYDLRFCVYARIAADQA